MNAAVPVRSYGTLRRDAAAQLRAAKIEDAEADARLLLCHAAGFDAAMLIARERDPASEKFAQDYAQLIARRIAGEPVARILGEKEFWSLRFTLGVDTLVPRADTETIVEAALAAIADRKRAIRILDLGTGTGAILAALLAELPSAYGVAVDRSEAALRVAKENLRNLSFGDRVSYLCSDWMRALGGTFELIVSNPPYIASGELALLSPDVRDHDPRLALEGGPDGLDAYRAIVPGLHERLAPDGVAVLELGQGQEAAVAALVAAEAGLRTAGPARPDLAGIARALVIHVKR